jgi:hypothetical protein
MHHSSPDGSLLLIGVHIQSCSALGTPHAITSRPGGGNGLNRRTPEIARLLQIVEKIGTKINPDVMWENVFVHYSRGPGRGEALRWGTGAGPRGGAPPESEIATAV